MLHHYITKHEQKQLMRISYLRFSDVFHVSRKFLFRTKFVFTTAGVLCVMFLR